VPFIGWGLFVLLGYPPFDFLNGNIWGPIISVVWIVGMILTFRYFRDKSARVHIFTSTPWFVWVALVAATSLAVALAEGFQSKYHYAWTISGVLLSLFYIGYGLKVKAEAR
jgi:acid phosphatase family membrane protein YuiD